MHGLVGLQRGIEDFSEPFQLRATDRLSAPIRPRCEFQFRSDTGGNRISAEI